MPSAIVWRGVVKRLRRFCVSSWLTWILLFLATTAAGQTPIWTAIGIGSPHAVECIPAFKSSFTNQPGYCFVITEDGSGNATLWSHFSADDSNGAVAWRLQFLGRAEMAPAEGSVFVAEADGFVSRYISDGSFLWRADTKRGTCPGDSL